VFITILLLGFIFLSGCSEEDKSSLIRPKSSLDPHPTIDEKNTSEDAIATFKSDKDFSNYEIYDYVLVKDDKIPLLKAVISFYDKEKNNSSNLAFIYDDLSRKICFAVNEVEGVKTYEIDENSQLTYVGNGAVTTSIRQIENNVVLFYKITFSYEESTSTTTIKIDSEKPSN
jgi:hypothetical protein